jgi:DNA (cytosine-5)-methyltransferase 1
MRPRLLDLFCGAGGCSVGYHRAGFDVVGVDIRPQPNYPFEFVQMDALDYLRWLDYSRWWRLDGVGDYFAAIHASPPCQAFSNAQRIQKNDHPDLLAPTRELLEATGLPYVIENVPGAPLRNPARLEGQMFGLDLYRPRLFETNWPLVVPALIPPPPRQAKMGRPPKAGEAVQVVGNFSDVTAARLAMGIDWMTRDELAQAIPPAYTEFIGEQLLEAIDNVRLAV